MEDVADDAGRRPSSALDGALRVLRALDGPCVPPVGVGAFDILYASRNEIVVWYTPARDGHTSGEVAIPALCLAGAWDALCAGATLDESRLEALAASPARARWLLALLAQLPGVRVTDEPLTLTLEEAHVPVTHREASG